MLGAILFILAQGGVEAFRVFGADFIWSGSWDPVREHFGALPAIVGTLATALIAILIAWPIGFGIAFFLTELAPRFLRGPLGVAIELLAAIPSIVYGMWGFFVLAPIMAAYVQPFLTTYLSEAPFIGILFQAPPIGVGLLTASLVLAIMMLPFIAATSRDVLASAPQLLKDGGYAMGATRWAVTTGIVVPAVRGSLFGAVFLGLGRALRNHGVTFVIGNAVRVPTRSVRRLSDRSPVANGFPKPSRLAKLAVLMALASSSSVASACWPCLLLRQGKMAWPEALFRLLAQSHRQC